MNPVNTRTKNTFINENSKEVSVLNYMFYTILNILQNYFHIVFYYFQNKLGVDSEIEGIPGEYMRI